MVIVWYTSRGFHFFFLPNRMAMSVSTQSATATASKVAIGIALGASAAFAAVSLNDLFQKDGPNEYPVQPLQGGAILTRELCWQGCEETYRMCGGTDACRTAFDACAEGCLAYPPAETLPGYVPPGYVPPGYLMPAEPVPGYAMPGYIIPGYDIPGYMTPGYVPPPIRRIAGFCNDRCVGAREACVQAGRPVAFCDERAVMCGDSCLFEDQLPPGYVPPAPLTPCQHLCIERYDICQSGARSERDTRFCSEGYAECFDRCEGRMPGADLPPGNPDVDPQEDFIKPPQNKLPPEYVNDNPPDPIAPNVNTTVKPQEWDKQGGAVAPQAEIKPDQAYPQDVYQKPEPEQGFFDKVWDFFAGDKKE